MNNQDGNESQKSNTVRQNQINELIKLFEEDSLQQQIIDELSNNIEQQAFTISGGYDTREYRTKLNTLKIRLKGTKGQYIRSVLSQQLMTPQELFSLDLSKLNETTINYFLQQNNRGVPTKQNLLSSAQKTIEVLKISSIKKEETPYQVACFSQSTEINEQNNQVKEIEKKTETINKQKVNENEKIVFAPQEEAVQQFEEFIDYSFEYNGNQRDFIEGNDFPNIEELQLKESQKISQQIELWGSPLPSDNILNQEFIQDDQEIMKESVQTRILDSQIQLEEQVYYDHQCSFQGQEVQNSNENQQIEEVKQQDQQDQQKDPLSHTHHFEKQIYEKVLRKHSLEVSKPETQEETQIQQIDNQNKVTTASTKEEFLQIMQQMETAHQQKVKQINEENLQLELELYQIQNAQAQELNALQNYQAQQLFFLDNLRKEKLLIEKTILENQKFNQSQIHQLLELQKQEKQQFQKHQLTFTQKIQQNRSIIQQIEFNSAVRNDQISKLQKQNETELYFDDLINNAQGLYFNSLRDGQQQIERVETNLETNEAEELIKQAIINADSGSTSIKKNQMKYQDFQEIDLANQNQFIQSEQQEEQVDIRQNRGAQLIKNQQPEEEKIQQNGAKKPQKRKNNQQVDQF